MLLKTTRLGHNQQHQIERKLFISIFSKLILCIKVQPRPKTGFFMIFVKNQSQSRQKL